MGQVYQITSNDKIYIGSTCKSMKERLRKHRCWELYDMNPDEFSIKILEKVEGDKLLLRQREQYYIDSCDCVNILSAYSGINKKDTDHNSYIKNRQKRIEQSLLYQKTDKAKDTQKKRYNKNKDKLKAWRMSSEIKLKYNKQRSEHRLYLLTWGGDERWNNNLHKISSDCLTY
tara:strand:- start:762 stop:1280 length:519 start_codon:yes stop_codon:yes gene_type:complete